MSAELAQVIQRLDVIKTELDYIKERVVDADMFLSKEDKEDLALARREFKARKTKTLQQLEKELV